MKKTWMFVTSLAGLALSTSVLLSLIPPLFDSGAQGSVWAAGVFACLAMIFAVGMLYWRPATPTSNGG